MPNFVSLPKDKIIYKLLLGPPESKKMVSGFVNAFFEQMDYASHSGRRSWEYRLEMMFGRRVLVGPDLALLTPGTS